MFRTTYQCRFYSSCASKLKQRIPLISHPYELSTHSPFRREFLSSIHYRKQKKSVKQSKIQINNHQHPGFMNSGISNDYFSLNSTKQGHSTCGECNSNDSGSSTNDNLNRIKIAVYDSSA